MKGAAIKEGPGKSLERLEKSLPFKKYVYHRFVRKLRDVLTFIKALRHSRDDLVQVRAI